MLRGKHQLRRVVGSMTHQALNVDVASPMLGEMSLENIIALS